MPTFARTHLQFRAKLARVSAALIAAAAWLHASGCAEPPAPPRNVILISVDTLRADHLGTYGYGRPTSPTIDRLAAEGVVFEDASTPSPWTLPAHASLLTGRYPSRHGLKSHDERMRADVATLAELLRDEGFMTAAVVNSLNLSSRYGLDRGFEQFKYVNEIPSTEKPSQVGKLALHWLLQPKRAERPFFLFLHYYDVHSDYLSLERYRDEFVRPAEVRADGSTGQLQQHRNGELRFGDADVTRLLDLYDAGIRQMDEGIRNLVAVLESQQLLDQTLIVLTSDHGEEFLEHGGVLHGRTQYQEVMHVPLIFRGPGIPAGTRVKEMVSLVDVLPTVAAILGVGPATGSDGMDLRPLWTTPFWRSRGEQWSTRMLFAEADHNNAEHDVKRAVRHARFKLHHDVASEEWQLFDLESDPDETVDTSGSEPELTALMRKQLEDFMADDREGEPIGALPPEDIEKLKSLGYLQ